jgi:hypothetical protein
MASSCAPSLKSKLRVLSIRRAALAKPAPPSRL